MTDENTITIDGSTADDYRSIATLLSVLYGIFHAGKNPSHHFDYRSIFTEATKRPELLAALRFLDVHIIETGWRAHTLSSDSKHRIKHFLRAIEGRDFEGLQLRRLPLDHYAFADKRQNEAAPGGSTSVTPQQAADNAKLLTALGDVFWPGSRAGDRFDHQRISAETRNHPQLFSAMAFLGIHKSNTGWRAGLLSVESKNKIKAWLESLEGQELDGRVLMKQPLGQYRVTFTHNDELPPYC